MTSPHADASQTQSPQSYLYTRLAANHLGDAAAAVVSALISYGRSTAREIAHKSGLPPKQVRSALVSLIQLNCVQYWSDAATATATAGTAAGTVHYAFSARGMDVLLHAGDIIAHVKAAHGDASAEAVQNVLENGSISVQAYLSSFDDAQARLDRGSVLVRLYTAGWLCRLQPFDQCPLEDLWHRMYQETLQAMPRSATTSEVKRVAEAREKTKAKVTALFAAGSDARDVFFVEHGMQRLRPEITLTVSLSRYEKHMRSRALTAYANSRVGLVSAQVYAACCALVEQKSPDMYHRVLQIRGVVVDPDEAQMHVRAVENALVDSKQTVFHLRDLVRALPAALDLRHSILTQNFVRPKRPASAAPPAPKKIKLEDGTALYAGADVEAAGATGAGLEDAFDFEAAGDTADTHAEALVAEHMRLLAACAVPFVVETGPGSYTIPFAQVAAAARQHHYDALIKTTLGPNALRVLRCIKAMRLVDEKAISNTVLLKDKTVKNEVYKLVTHNVVEIQEVPRSADRAASKTFYLFRHREAPAHAFVARSLLYSMGALLSNVQDFKAEHRILLDKCEREDVKGREDELLLESELKTLRDLQVREVRNIGRFNRIKWLSFVFGVL